MMSEFESRLLSKKLPIKISQDEEEYLRNNLDALGPNETHLLECKDELIDKFETLLKERQSDESFIAKQEDIFDWRLAINKFALDKIESYRKSEY